MYVGAHRFYLPLFAVPFVVLFILYDMYQLSTPPHARRLSVADMTSQAAAGTAAVAAVAAAPAVGVPSPSGDYVDYPLSEQALAIARSLTVSKQTVPHYYLTVDLK